MSWHSPDAQEYVPTVREQERYWDERWDLRPEPNTWQLRRADKIIELLGTVSLHQPRILDLGCATGWFTERLARLGEATGIDLCAEAIARARTRYRGVRFEAGNIFEMALPAAHYDVVVAQEVVAHVPDQAGFVNIIAGTLKPGGYLVISAANKVVMDRVDFGPDPREHIKRWLTLGDLKRLVRPRFTVLRGTSVIPLGDRGFLRIVNSHRLSGLFRWLISPERLDAWRERAGWGYSVIVLAQKRA